MKTTIAIITRGNDPKLMDTLESIKNTTKKLNPEIILVIDGKKESPPIPRGIKIVYTDTESRGTSFARHTAMMNASNDIVVTCDSHMSFPVGWLEDVEEHLYEFNNHVLCFRTQMINKDDGQVHIYSGAKFDIKIVGSPDNKNQCRNEGERQPFGGGWRTKNYDGPIQCVMGGCYSLTKSFYIDKLKECWKLGKGWGADEETISLMTWYKGGLCWLMPKVIKHYCGYRGFVDRYAGFNTEYNRKRIVEMIDDKLTRDDLLNWYDSYIATKPDTTEVAKFREKHITPTKYGYGFVSLIDDFEGRIRVKHLKEVLKQRGIKYNPSLNKEELIKLWKTEMKKEEKKIKKVIKKTCKANYGAFENRRSCHKCGSSDSKVIKTRTTGRVVSRYRICLDCKTRRVTTEIIPKID